jgi:hypothetical protein
MDKSDRETLLQCANIILEQKAALNHWKKQLKHGELSNIRSLKQFEILAKQSQPHLGQIENQVEHPLTDKAAFDTLRNFLKAATA